MSEQKSKKITLKVADRLNLILGVLPQQGNYFEVKKINEIKEKIEITEEDQKKCKMKELEKGGIAIEKENDFEVEYEFSEEEFKVIKEALEQKDREKKLTLEMENLYRKFVL